MRLLSAVGAALLLTAPALAADMSALPPPVLRGALPAHDASVDWSGFYAGGFWGFSAGNTSTDSQSNINTALESMTRDTGVQQSIRSRGIVQQGRNQDSGLGFGGFVGYNFVIDDAVFGIEVDYTRSRLRSGLTGEGSGLANISPSRDESWFATTSSKVKVTDFGSVRGRLGYAFGNFLPYITAGVGLMRASTETAATIRGQSFTYNLNIDGNRVGAPNVGTLAFPYNGRVATQVRTKMYAGYALGFGLDYALSSNIFLRAELQHMRFSSIGGATLAINSARAGAAVKF